MNRRQYQILKKIKKFEEQLIEYGKKMGAINKKLEAESRIEITMVGSSMGKLPKGKSKKGIIEDME